MPANILETLFPNLKAGGYAITSDMNAEYNCIAWAAGDTQKWWEPFSERYYWPPGALNEYSLAAYSQAFAVYGYALCDDSAPEAGFEKIAIYVDAQGIPAHAARQLPSGKSPAARLEQGLPIDELPRWSAANAEADAALSRDALKKLEAVNEQELSHEESLTLTVVRWDARNAIEGARHFWLRSPVTPYAFYARTHTVF